MTSTLVDSLTAAPPEAVPYVIQNLAPLREHAMPILKTRFRESDLEPTEELHIACALAQLGEFDFAFPFASLKDASPGECSNVVDAFKGAPDAWLSALDDQFLAGGTKWDWSFKARLAIVALHLRNRKLAEVMLKSEDRTDPIRRTVFIETLPNWHGDLGDLRQQLADSECPGMRSGICLAIGSIGDIAPEAKSQWQDLLTQWYLTQPDGGTHSAAGWALRQWGVSEPPIDDVNLREDREWWVTEQTGLTMIRIRAGTFERPLKSTDPDSDMQVVRITRDILLSDREITVELFGRFTGDKDYQGEKPKPRPFRDPCLISPGDPEQSVSWYDAVKFCNWLSWKENLTPCYRLSERPIPGRATSSGKEGEAENEDLADRANRLIMPDEEYEVEITEEANGFRLPTEAQWEYACRAGTTTRYSFGDDEAMLVRYGSYAAAALPSGQAGTRAPNAWGLFDMHGSGNEWCWDWYALAYEFATELEDPSGPSRGSTRVYRFGSRGTSVRGSVKPSFRLGSFRVALFPLDQSAKGHASGVKSGTKQSDMSEPRSAEPHRRYSDE